MKTIITAYTVESHGQKLLMDDFRIDDIDPKLLDTEGLCCFLAFIYYTFYRSSSISLEYSSFMLLFVWITYSIYVTSFRELSIDS